MSEHRFTTAQAVLFRQNIIAGEFTPENMAWLQDGFRRVEEFDGALTWERCFYLPSRKSDRRSLCASYVAEALELIAGNSLEGRCRELKQRLDAFTSRGLGSRVKGHSPAACGLSALDGLLLKIAGTLKPGDGTSYRTLIRLAAQAGCK